MEKWETVLKGIIEEIVVSVMKKRELHNNGKK